jgi:hypothetical protein
LRRWPFRGIAAVPVSVQVQFVPGMVNFLVVGLPDEAVAESRERPTLRRSLGKGESADPAMLLGKP